MEKRVPSTDFKLQHLYDAQLISKLDYHFARTISKIFKEKDPIVIASCAFISKAVSSGHICIDLKSVHQKSSLFFNEPVLFPSLEKWISSLQTSRLVSYSRKTPLVLINNCYLYMSRYYDLEQRLIQNISFRLTQSDTAGNAIKPDDVLKSFYPEINDYNQPQIEAVKHAVNNPLTIISGGPGTGKTFVTAIIKKILSSGNIKGISKPYHIISVAPTGKAASKLEQGKTIHSILKPLNNKPGFYHNSKRPLPVDVVIIDEASMIDIGLLTRLLEAIPLNAKIVLLGDVHQLSSIQAGSVLADICKAEPVQPCLFHLNYNFRSKGKTGIDLLSRAINDNNPNQIEKILLDKTYTDIEFIPIENENFSQTIQTEIQPYLSSLMDALTPETALTLMDQFKILCAHNSGRYGTLSINHICENILRSRPNSGMKDWHFKGLVMINLNDYHKNLFNGDTGIIIQHNMVTDAQDRLNRHKKSIAFFPALDSDIRKFRSADLPSHDSAFAITIHKSQGSEFNTAFIVLPDQISPVLTRQLLYTGVTRAKDKVILAGDIDIIKQATQLTVSRASGITQGLNRADTKSS